MKVGERRFPVVPISSRAQEEVPMDWTGGQVFCPLSIGSQSFSLREPMAGEPLQSRHLSACGKTEGLWTVGNHWERSCTWDSDPRKAKSTETVE